MVSVGFWQAELGQQPPSMTNRFEISWAWQNWFRTLVRGSSPILVVPISWMIRPGALSDLSSLRISAPDSLHELL